MLILTPVVGSELRSLHKGIPLLRTFLVPALQPPVMLGAHPHLLKATLFTCRQTIRLLPGISRCFLREIPCMLPPSPTLRIIRGEPTTHARMTSINDTKGETDICRLRTAKRIGKFQNKIPIPNATTTESSLRSTRIAYLTFVVMFILCCLLRISALK